MNEEMVDANYGQSAGFRPSYTLHPLHGIVWAAFWGAPVAAGIVMAINYSRAGSKSSAGIAAVVGLIATLGLFVFLFAIPSDILDSIPNAAFVIPQLVAVYLVAKSLQADLIADHAASGGVVASAWPSVGIGMLCLPFAIGILVGAGFLFESSFGTVMEFGDDEVFYAGDATEDDARKLARVLQERGFFGAGGASVRIHASSGEYAVSFVLVDDTWDDPETVDSFRELGRSLSEAFPTPLEIQLCDGYLTTQNSITIQSRE